MRTGRGRGARAALRARHVTIKADANVIDHVIETWPDEVALHQLVDFISLREADLISQTAMFIFFPSTPPSGLAEKETSGSNLLV